MIAAFYKEGFGYQENLLPIKHHQLGYDVTVVTFDKYGAYGNLKADNKGIKTYVNDFGVKVIVLPDNDSILLKLPLSVFKRCINRTKHLYETLCQEKPDIIFIHGILASDHELVVKYKKHNPDVKVYMDSHNDYYNAPLNTFQDKIKRKVIGRKYVKDVARVAEKVWGVTPWRIDYLRDVYQLSGSKVGLLVMGGDENLIDFENRATIRDKFRQNHNIPKNAFVVVTGGKIDKPKNIHLLIDAVKNNDNPLLYLVVFGNYTDDLKDYTEVKHPRIINLGWVPSDAVYNIFLASDLGAFPGTHSVLWEQACASGIPCIFKDWDGGFNHVDLGGNCVLMKNITIETLSQTISDIMNDKDCFDSMCKVAETKCRKVFAYTEIAKRSIEIN